MVVEPSDIIKDLANALFEISRGATPGAGQDDTVTTAQQQAATMLADLAETHDLRRMAKCSACEEKINLYIETVAENVNNVWCPEEQRWATYGELG